ncbi:MAG: shikimate dehydrogenase [Mariprofundaceae bacterium]|nr:shikimate dehydrogenase [Mariprofundaceae bacterium]
MNISGKTKLFGIIGNPIEHSLSPVFQSRFLEQSGVDAVYVPFCVQEGDVEAAVRGLWALNVRGFNVTVPYKESILPHVEPDESARVIGAVNTVMRGKSGWIATNTDWIGFSAALEAVEADMKEASVLIFGAGGTARAVVYALSQMGIARLYICNRSQERAEALAAYTRENYSLMDCELIKWGESNVEAVSLKCGVVINTTSIGLKEGDMFPFPLAGGGVAVDAVYRPDGDTVFCRAARAGGRRAVDGLPMLIAQGAASFSQWHGVDTPDRLSALRWTEERTGRAHVELPGWGREE